LFASSHCERKPHIASNFFMITGNFAGHVSAPATLPPPSSSQTGSRKVDTLRGPSDESGVFGSFALSHVPPSPTPLPLEPKFSPPAVFGHTGEEHFSHPSLSLPRLGVLSDGIREALNPCCYICCFRWARPTITSSGSSKGRQKRGPPGLIEHALEFTLTYVPCIFSFITAVLLFHGALGANWCLSTSLIPSTTLPPASQAFTLIVVSAALSLIQSVLTWFSITWGCPSPVWTLPLFGLPIISLSLTAAAIRSAGGAYLSGGSVCIAPTGREGPGLVLAGLILELVNLVTLTLYMIFFAREEEESHSIVATGHSTVLTHGSGDTVVHFGMYRGATATKNPLHSSDRG
jgi:hypothetical protein